MAKNWSELTRREKLFGGAAAVFALVAITGVAGAMGGGGSTSTTEPIEQETRSVTTTKEVQETVAVPFEKTTVEDPISPKGTTSITTVGADGIKTLTYKVTLVDGAETGRELVGTVTTTQPINEVTSIGTYVAPVQQKAVSNCDPNYSGACVPIDSDVDCGGGSGNGPSYLYGTAQVVGTDIYKLDGDGDGLACE